MAVEQSILKGTKKTLGLDENYNAFDHDVITHLNTCFFTLNQLGVGPPEGFRVEGPEELWDEYTGGNVNLNAVQTYVYLKVRLLFDPPGTAHHINMMQEQVEELEYRLKMEREMDSWVAPGAIGPFDTVVIDGGEG